MNAMTHGEHLDGVCCYHAVCAMLCVVVLTCASVETTVTVEEEVSAIACCVCWDGIGSAITF